LRYAIVADIHGNLIALKAVLNDIYKNKVDKIILLGDYYFDFPWTNEIVDLIRNIKNSYAVKGNKEDYLKNLENQDQSSWTRLKYKCNFYEVKYIYVNPAYTSKVCSGCSSFGKRQGDVFECPICGKSHADLNASINILIRRTINKVRSYICFYIITMTNQ